MRSLILLIATTALTAEAPPQTEVESFDQALAVGHVTDATVIIDKLIAERMPSNGKPKPDPLLNALIGRVALASNNFEGAAAYLDNAPLGALPLPLRAETGLAYGKALEAIGKRTDALAAYREAFAASSSDVDKEEAALSIARAILPDNPAAAKAQVSNIATGPATPRRWEAQAIVAAASSLQGDLGSADRAARDAWADANIAPVESLAPLQVSVLRAGIAAARHDTRLERAMLTSAGGLAVTANAALSDQLPVCGTGGVRPSDFVIFGYDSGPYGIRQLIPISASRPEIVRAFNDALSLTVPVKAGADSRAPFGTVFTVACRTVVSASVLTKPLNRSPLLDWLVGQGLYPVSASFESDDQHLKAVANRVDALVAKYGKDSPLLIGPRWQQLLLLEARVRAGDPVPVAQFTDLTAEFVAGLRRRGAPDWLASPVKARARLLQPANTEDNGEAHSQIALEPLREVPPELARPVIALMMNNLPNEWPGAAAQFVIDMSPRITPALSGIERQSWLLMLAKAQRTLLRDSEAAATLVSAQLAPDLCVATFQPPKLLEHHFSYGDYPQELVLGDQQGAVLYDFDVTSTGDVGRHRILYSIPSGLFDEASDKGLTTVRYIAPTRDGKANACRGVYQPIIWRLESGSNAGPLRILPDTGQPTT